MKHKISKFQRKKLIIKAHKLLDRITFINKYWDLSRKTDGLSKDNIWIII